MYISPFTSKTGKILKFFAITQEIPLSDKYVFERLRSIICLGASVMFWSIFPFLKHYKLYTHTADDGVFSQIFRQQIKVKILW